MVALTSSALLNPEAYLQSERETDQSEYSHFESIGYIDLGLAD